jgi:hypothetical protein
VITGNYAKEASEEDKLKDENGVTNPNLHQRISTDVENYRLSICSTDYCRSYISYDHNDEDNPEEIP